MLNDPTVIANKQAELRQLLAQASQQGEEVITMSTVSVEDYAEIPNNQTIQEVQFPFKGTRMLYRQEPNGNQIPFKATKIGLNLALFKSKVHETFGMLMEGVSLYVYGYDVETDGQGNILADEIDNPAYTLDPENQPEKVKVPRLITQDAEGHLLRDDRAKLTFRPQWGVDQSKQAFTRLRTQDMLNLVPNIGVPRKGGTIVEAGETDTETATPTDEATARRRRDSIDWLMIPGLQPQLEKPLLNNALEISKLETELEGAEGDRKAQIEAELVTLYKIKSIIDKIPVASNAPSQRVQTTAGAPAFTTPAGQAASTMPKDAFAPPPEKK